MPPGEKKLSAAEKAAIAAWIDAGAERPAPSPSRLRPRPGRDRRGASRSGRSGRSVAPEVPQVAHPRPVRTPIDAFLLAKLEAGRAALLARGRPARR